MSEKRALNIGLIGYQFMGRAHSHAIKALHVFGDELPFRPVMRVICGRNEAAARKVADHYGWERVETSWENVVADPEIDVIDIVTPGDTHCPIAVAAAEAGKHVICEKPLALTGDEARRMHEAAVRNKVKHVVNFNYRQVPAVIHAHRLVTEGTIGDVCSFHGSYRQDWSMSPDVPFVWRFDEKVAGAGSMADNGSHIIDLARYLVGEFAEVTGQSTIFRPERVGADGKPKPVTTDDAAVFLARFRDGALGFFHTSRFCPGHKNGLQFEINGTKGSIRWDLERLNELEVFVDDGAAPGAEFQRIMVTEGGAHPYVGHWWPPGHILGWEHTFVHQLYALLKAIAEDGPTSPDFEDGLKCQLVIDALAEAEKSRGWVALK